MTTEQATRVRARVGRRADRAGPRRARRGGNGVPDPGERFRLAHLAALRAAAPCSPIAGVRPAPAAG